MDRNVWNKKDFEACLKSFILSFLIVSILTLAISPVSAVRAKASKPVHSIPEKKNAHFENPSNSGELSTYASSSLTENTNETSALIQDTGQYLSCYYLGGSFPIDAQSNRCDPNASPSRSITNGLELEAPPSQNPNTHVTYVCDGQNCPPLPIYYSLSCSVDWLASNPYTFSPVVNSSGNAVEHINQKSCGSGQSGGCSATLFGKIDNVYPNTTVSERIALNNMLAGTFQWDCSLSWSLDPLPSQNADLSTNQPKNGSGDGRECEISNCDDGQALAGDPVNLLTGNFDYSIIDLSLQTIAGPLTLQRSYASQAIDPSIYSNEMGAGWTHNQDIRIILGENTVWLKGQTLNQYLFMKRAGNVFEPYPGVTASLTFNTSDNTYLLTTDSKSIYRFDSSGKLSEWRNSSGYGFNYSYNQDGKVEQVFEPYSQRYFHFIYTNGKLTKVEDNQGRFVLYGSTDGYQTLTSFTDARNQTWIYTYDNQRLSAIKEPGSAYKNILSITYDTQGRATEQRDGLGNLIIKIQYLADGTRLVSDALDRTCTYQYDARNLLVSETNSAGYPTTKSYYSNQKINKIEDQDGRATTYEWSTSGGNLTKVTDAEGYSTQLAYTNPSYPGLITQVTDPRGKVIDFIYDDAKLQSIERQVSTGTIHTLY